MTRYAAMFDELDKIAEDQFSEVPNRWVSGQRVQNRAIREGFKEDPAKRKEHTLKALKGLVIGGPTGGVLGAGVGAGVSTLSGGRVPMSTALWEGATMGSRVGGPVGMLLSTSKLRKGILESKGIKDTHGFLGRGRMAPGVIEKYLKPKELAKEKTAEEKRKYVTKEKFKRHLKTLAPVAIGTGLGVATGEALKSWNAKHRPLRKHPKLMKYAPVAGAALGAGAAYLGKLQSKKIRDYIEYGDDGPKQHSKDR